MPDICKIGEAARATGLSIDAIRFYEKQGLLQSPSRSQGGFRLFQESDIANLRFIRSGQSLGFSLQEIRELLSIQNAASCANVKRLLEMKLVSIREKIAELNSLEGQIAAALQECKRALRRANSRNQATCPVLNLDRPRKVRKK